jgi:hypothetical protein
MTTNDTLQMLIVVLQEKLATATLHNAELEALLRLERDAAANNSEAPESTT